MFYIGVGDSMQKIKVKESEKHVRLAIDEFNEGVIREIQGGKMADLGLVMKGGLPCIIKRRDIDPRDGKEKPLFWFIGGKALGDPTGRSIGRFLPKQKSVCVAKHLLKERSKEWRYYIGKDGFIEKSRQPKFKKKE